MASEDLGRLNKEAIILHEIGRRLVLCLHQVEKSCDYFDLGGKFTTVLPDQYFNLMPLVTSS
jgi:hypothetical protein